MKWKMLIWCVLCCVVFFALAALITTFWPERKQKKRQRIKVRDEKGIKTHLRETKSYENRVEMHVQRKHLLFNVSACSR